MEWWSVRETAEQLGLSEQRVRAMAKSGRLSARRVGQRWVIDADPARLRKGHSGRPLAAANAWALLALLSGDSPNWVHPSVRSRLRRRLADIDWLEAALANGEARARILRWRVLPADLAKLQAADQLVLSGLSADHPDLDVLPNPQQIDAYASENSVRGIELRFRPERSSSRPNLILRLPSHEWILRRQEPQAPQAVVAADLLGHDDARVARAARRLLHRLANG